MYEVPDDTKCEFLRRFGMVPEDLPPGRVDEIFYAWDPSDPPPGKAGDPQEDLINADDDGADAYFHPDNHPDLQQNPIEVDPDTFGKVVAGALDEDADGDSDPEYNPASEAKIAPTPYDPYAIGAGTHPPYAEPAWLAKIVMPSLPQGSKPRSLNCEAGHTLKDTRKPQLASLGGQPFEKISPTTFNTRLDDSLAEAQEIDIFLKFFPLTLMKTFAQYTNKRFHTTQDPTSWKDDSRFDRWYDTCAAELYVFMGIVVYLSSYFEHEIDKFWARSSSSRPVHPLRRYMSRDRFRLLFRFFCTWDPTTERDADPFVRVDRLAAQIRLASQQLWKPGTSFAVDEAICKFFGRSKHKLRFPHKPIKVGLKAFCLGWRGYIFNFAFVGKGSTIANMPPDCCSIWPKSTLDMASTQRCVWWLCKALPKPPSGHLWYHLFVDNLFPTQLLLNSLREINVATSGTARVNLTGISAYFTQLKRAQDRVPWGETLVMPTLDGKSMAIAWKDNAIVLFISNVFSGAEEPVFRERKMARQSIAEKKKHSLRDALNGKERGLLPIPLIVDTYNQRINGIDIADHYRSLSNINQHRFYRGPAQALVFDFLLGMVITNYSILMREVKRSFLPSGQRIRYSQKDFQDQLFRQLMAKFCAQAKQQRGPTVGQTKRESPRAAKPTTANPAADHTRSNQAREDRARCKACSKRFRTSLGKPYDRKRQSLKTIWCCSGCLDSRGNPVPLHSDGDCFDL